MGIFDNKTIAAGFDAWANFGTFGAWGGLNQAKEGAEMSEKAENDISEYERQTITNPYKNLEVSTLGADLRTKELQRSTATGIDALSKGGVRGVVGGVQGLVSASQNATAEIAAYLDEQQKEVDKLQASGEQWVQQMTENRENQDLMGLARQYELGMELEQKGQQTMQEAPWKAIETGISAAKLFI